MNVSLFIQEIGFSRIYAERTYIFLLIVKQRGQSKKKWKINNWNKYVYRRILRLDH